MMISNHSARSYPSFDFTPTPLLSHYSMPLTEHTHDVYANCLVSLLLCLFLRSFTWKFAYLDLTKFHTSTECGIFGLETHPVSFVNLVVMHV